MTAHGAQWRYDSLNSRLNAAYGTLTLDMCVEIISFLSPNGDYPTYWTNTIDDSDPMSAIVEGVFTFIFDYEDWFR